MSPLTDREIKLLAEIDRYKYNPMHDPQLITKEERDMLMNRRFAKRLEGSAWTEAERKAHRTYMGSDRVSEILGGTE